MDGNISSNTKKLFKRTVKLLSKLFIVLITAILIGYNSLCIRSDEIDSKNVVYATPSSSAIVMEVSTKRILYQSNIHQKLPMASTTKIMTALTVIDNAELDEIVTIPRQAVGIEGSSIYLRENEKLSIEELLYGLMLRSGNDAATALAIYIGGSINEFVDMMNSKAVSMGLKNTHFQNPHGLHHDNHYTSGYDLAYISAVAMQNKDFAKIVGTKMATISGGNGNRYLYNKNKLLNSYAGCTGIKTGFTKRAGRCLVTGGKRNDMEVVCVVLNCGPMFEECARLMDWAYENYKMQSICCANQPLAQINVLKGKKALVQATAKMDIVIPIKKDGSEKYSLNVVIPKELVAPIFKGQQVGSVTVYVDDCLLFSRDVYSIDSIERKGAIDYIRDFFK